MQRIADTQKWIVITGAAGFIGSCTVRYLNDLGYTNLLLVDDLKKSIKWKNLVGKDFVDIICQKDLFSFLEGKENQIQAFVHLGACSNTMEEDAQYLLENNFHFTVRLARYALKHGHRFIYASSAATYGNGENGFVDEEDSLSKLAPLNMYGYSKHLVDLWAQRENVLHKIVGLKYFNVFGPNEYHKNEMRSIIHKMYGQILSKGKVELFASNDPDIPDGGQKRDFIYVKDVVRMSCAFLMQSYKNVGGIFNIGSSKARSFNDVASALYLALNKKPHISYIPMPEALSRQYQNFTEASMKKYLSALKLDATSLVVYTLEDAVKDYVCNYLCEGKTW